MRSVVVTGSVAYDYIMAMPGRFKDHIMPDKLHILNVSFLMDKLRQEMGGTGGNQAYGLALLNVPVSLVAAAGKDFSKGKKHLKKAGVDISGLKELKGELTARAFVMTDKDSNQIWGFYQGVMKKAIRLGLSEYYKQKPMVVITPNQPEAMIKYVKECIKQELDYLFDPAFYIPSIAKKDLIKGIKGAKIVIGNDYEVELMLRKTRLGKREILTADRILITTLGSKGSLIEKGKERLKIPVAKPKNTSDPTGAGDAYRAGFIAGYLRDLPLSVCGRMGAVSAAYTVEKYGTQTHKFGLKEFAKRYKSNFGKTLSI